MEVLRNKKILFIQTSFIGDAVLCLPAIQEFKKNEPLSEISVICIPSTQEIFRNSPVIDNVIVFDKRGVHRSLFSFIKFSKEIRKMNFNNLYSFHRSFRTTLLVLQSRVKETYGFSNSSLKYGYRYLINYNYKEHEVKRNLSLIGMNPPGEAWRVLPEIVSIQSSAVNDFYKKNKLENFVTIAPGSIWNTKKYPSEYLSDIIVFLTSLGNQVVLIGSKNDTDLCNSLLLNEKVLSAAGLFSIPETIQILKGSRFLISNDSAPAHLAMFVDIPVLMIYCSTVPSFGFYPYNQGSTWISFDNLACKPCGIHGYNKCPLGHFKCAYELKSTQIIDILKEKFL